MEQVRRRVSNLHQPRVQAHQEEKGLIVRKVPAYTIAQNYEPKDTDKFALRCDFYYVTCSLSGDINWKIAKVYDAYSLVGKNNVKIIKIN